MKKAIHKLDKFGDISIGDIVSMNGSSYVIYNDMLNENSYGMENVESTCEPTNLVNLTRDIIESFIKKDGLKLKAKKNISKCIKSSYTLVSLSEDKKINDIIKTVFYNEECVLYYHPLIGKLYNFHEDNVHLFLEESMRVSNDALNYIHLFSKEEAEKVLKDISIDKVSKINLM